MEKVLGKIKSITLGRGGYQGAMFGVTIMLEMKNSSTGDFKGTWSTHTDRCEWTVEDQRNHFADVMEFLRDTMKLAKVDDMAKLAGTPVEVTLNGMALESWRVLEEVL